MRTLARQQRPRPAFAPLLVSAAVRFLSVSIVVVTMPAWPQASVGFEHCVHYTQSVDHQRVVGRKDSITNKLEKSAVDDIPRWIGLGGAWRLACELECGFVYCAGSRNFSGFGWIQAYKIAVNAGKK